jgi:hypothetical protein
MSIDYDAAKTRWRSWVEGGETYYKCAVNPGLDPGRKLGALGWCARLVTRIEDYGFDEAHENGRLAASQRRGMAVVG